MSNQLFIDIETIPDDLDNMPKREDLEFHVEPVTPKIPAGYKKQETIDAWIKDKLPELQKKANIKTLFESADLYTKAYSTWSKQCFRGLTNRVVAISYAWNDEKIKQLFVGDEEDIIYSFIKYGLSEVMQEGSTTQWIAYNAVFDLNILATKVLKYGTAAQARHIPWNAKLWDTARVFDPMHQFPHQDRNFYKQDAIAKFFGIESKTVMSGADVLPYFLDGKHQLISEYCAEDVDVLRQITRRLGA